MEEERIQQIISEAESIRELMHFTLAEGSLSFADHEKVVNNIMCLQKHLALLKKLQLPLITVNDLETRDQAAKDLERCSSTAKNLWSYLQRFVPTTQLASIMLPFSVRLHPEQAVIEAEPIVTTPRGEIQRPISIFFSYIYIEEDTRYQTRLIKQLSSLRTEGRIEVWYEGNAALGTDAGEVAVQQLNEADIVLLPISPGYLASDMGNSQILQALRKYEKGAMAFIILVRPIYLPANIARLPQLPSNGKAITSWRNKDEALHNVEKGIHNAVEKLEKQQGHFTPQSNEGLAKTQGHTGAISSKELAPTPENRQIPLQGKATRASSTTRRKRCDVLLVTAKIEETQPLIRACEQASHLPFQRAYIKKSVYHDLHLIEGTHTFLVQTGQGDKGSGGAALTVHDAIQHLKPSAVILVGVAFGMHIKDQQMGDILISRQILDYEVQRIDEDENGIIHIRQRGNRQQASQYLLSLINSCLVDWKGPKVHQGLMFSGDKVANSITFRKQLRDFEPEGIGGEMEGAGLYAAAERNHVDWIVIKSISDWADGEMSTNKSERQQIASENAAQFVIHILHQGGLARSS